MANLICIVCPKGCHLQVDEQNDFLVSGNACERGAEYGKTELVNPTRVITSTVCVNSGVFPRMPVKTDKPIPKAQVFAAVKLLDDVCLDLPVLLGQVVVENICGTGANFVACRAVK